ncbi:MAG: 50S ribosomal protein L20 [Acholeplasmataceae bacterium]
MARIKYSVQSRRRRKKTLKLAKGYFGSKRTLYRTANEQVMRSLSYSYRDRKQRKRNFRKLWITRINAASTLNGLKYSRFIYGLTLANVQVNRKMLADLAVNEPDAFKTYVDLAKDAIENPNNYTKNHEEVLVPESKALANGKSIKEPKPVKKETKKVDKPKVEEKAKTEVKEESKDLSKLLVADLREIAKDLKIENYSSLRKAELIDAINKAK